MNFYCFGKDCSALSSGNQRFAFLRWLRTAIATWLRVDPSCTCRYLAEGTAKDAAVDEFETALPANLSMIARWQHPTFALFAAHQTS